MLIFQRNEKEDERAVHPIIAQLLRHESGCKYLPDFETSSSSSTSRFLLVVLESNDSTQQYQQTMCHVHFKHCENAIGLDKDNMGEKLSNTDYYY